jgi:uncharacterized protein YceH (UPF0502 family)
MDLSAPEIRVLGCLLEKQRTTPDHYPLSLNSLRLACNQSTNREPVVEYDDAVIRDALHRLERRGYARLAGASRAAKYRHLLSQALPMSDGEQAVMCVLMLRGPQTPGELKQRGERIHAFEDLQEVHATLAGLIERDLARRLGRRPGQKEERYVQQLGESSLKSSNGDGFATPAPTAPPPNAAVTEIASSQVAPAQVASSQMAPAQTASSQVASGQVAPAQMAPAHTASSQVAPAHAAPMADAASDELHERVARLERELAELRAALLNR